MAIGLGTMLKLARGGMSQDEMMEMLSAAGIEANMTHVAQTDIPAAFQELAVCASLPQSGILHVEARMKTGDVLHGLLVVRKSQ